MRIQRLAIAAAVLHTLVLAAFTFPAEWVPTRFWYWSQAYSRVLFHQDWRLFAPDPPACGCSIEYRVGSESEWRRLEDRHPGPIWQRMAANACRFTEASFFSSETPGELPGAIVVGLTNMIDLEPGSEARVRLDRPGSICVGEFLTVEFVLGRDQAPQ